MSLKVNGVEIENVNVNGVAVDVVNVNNIEIFTSRQAPFSSGCNNLSGGGAGSNVTYYGDYTTIKKGGTWKVSYSMYHAGYGNLATYYIQSNTRGNLYSTTWDTPDDSDTNSRSGNITLTLQKGEQIRVAMNTYPLYRQDYFSATFSMA